MVTYLNFLQQILFLVTSSVREDLNLRIINQHGKEPEQWPSSPVAVSLQNTCYSGLFVLKALKCAHHCSNASGRVRSFGLWVSRSGLSSCVRSELQDLGQVWPTEQTSSPMNTEMAGPSYRAGARINVTGHIIALGRTQGLDKLKSGYCCPRSYVRCDQNILWHFNEKKYYSKIHISINM